MKAAAAGSCPTVVPGLILQRHGSVLVQQDGGRVLHPADSPGRRAGHPEPAAALVAHRPCLLLVDGLLVGLQDLLQRQLPGLGQVPRLSAVRGGGYTGLTVLGASGGGSSHDCDVAEPMLHSVSTGAIYEVRRLARSPVSTAFKYRSYASLRCQAS